MIPRDGDAVDGDQRRLLQGVRAAGGDWPADTAEIADHVDEPRRTTLRRLTNLEERGLVESKQVGNGARIWRIVEAGELGYHGLEVPDDVEAALADVLMDVEIPGYDDDVIETRRAYVYEFLRLLWSHEQATTASLKLSMPVLWAVGDHDPGYGSPQSAWAALYLPALRQLRERALPVDGDRGGHWTFDRERFREKYLDD